MPNRAPSVALSGAAIADGVGVRVDDGFGVRKTSGCVIQRRAAGAGDELPEASLAIRLIGGVLRTEAFIEMIVSAHHHIGVVLPQQLPHIAHVDVWTVGARRDVWMVPDRH